jgi:hypothetical protein
MRRTRKSNSPLPIGFCTLAMLLFAGIATAAPVQAPKPEETCLAYDSVYESAPLLAIQPGPGRQRVYLLSQRKLCVESQPCAARQKSYLVAGDIVFASAPADGFRCVYYGTARGHIVAGFVPVANLVPVAEDRQLSAEFVAGTWMYEGDSIVIKAAGPARVSGEGHAIYQTRQTINEGDFTADASINPGQSELVFKDGDGETACIVTLHRRGPYLVVADNNNCGGMNVRFDGIYTRAKRK